MPRLLFYRLIYMKESRGSVSKLFSHTPQKGKCAMLDYFFSNSTGWFTLPAVVGSFLFIVRLALLLLAGVGHADVDLHVDSR